MPDITKTPPAYAVRRLSLDKLRFVKAEEEVQRLPEIVTDFRAAA